MAEGRRSTPGAGRTRRRQRREAANPQIEVTASPAEYPTMSPPSVGTDDTTQGAPSRPPHDDDLLSPAQAAATARRSVRTIRRAYRRGTLVAYRDGNGRGVRIRYGDLHQWLLAGTASAPPRRTNAPPPPGPRKRLDMGGKTATEERSENLDLLNAARARLRPGGAPSGGGRRRSAGSPGARSA